MVQVTYGTAGVTYGTVGVDYDEPSFSSVPVGTFWSVDGLSLQTYAWNIVTWGGTRQSPPPLRGEDTLIPHSAGRSWNPRVPDSKVITLGMWVIGAEEDGSLPTNANMRAVFEENWQNLRRLLWNPNKQMELSKSFYLPGHVLKHAIAKAQYAGGLEPEMGGPYRAAFTVDLLLSDPFFYGSREIFTVEASTPYKYPASASFDAETTKVNIRLNGPLVNPILSYNLLDPQAGFIYSGTILAGEHVDIDVENFKAVKTTPTGSQKVVGRISNLGGSYFWLPLGPTPANILLTSEFGAGNAEFSVSPAWI